MGRCSAEYLVASASSYYLLRKIGDHGEEWQGKKKLDAAFCLGNMVGQLERDKSRLSRLP